MFTAVLILILLTEMIIYAVQTGVFEQRKSSNEMRQKQAFHLADSALQEARQFMSLNSVLVASPQVDLLPDGTDGWLSGGSAQRWLPCSSITDTTHPCFSESNSTLRSASYYYSFGGSNELPLSPSALGSTVDTTQQVHIYALLCMLELDRTADPVVQGCTTDTDKQDSRYFMVTLAARGEADCLTDGSACKSESLVSEKIGSYGPLGGEGGPGTPLVARTTVPASGTVELVPNPNGGGDGVPLSAWVNANPSCQPDGLPFDPQSGSYATCERHEFYGVAEFPSDYKCPTSNCSCSKSDDKLLSYVDTNERIINFDIVEDTSFPCDIFEYTFGVPKTDYIKVRDSIAPSHLLSDCSGLDENSFGTYWVSGSSCMITSSVTVGSAEAPVFLISAAGTTQIHGSIFGILFVTDAEDSSAQFTGNGKGTIYGAAIMDADMKNFNGTFQIVYLENVLNEVTDTGGFGSIQGGWTDFHASWK